MAVDGTGNLLATSLSRESIWDASELAHLLETCPGPLASLIGDRGYDQASVYREALGRNATAFIIIHPFDQRDPFPSKAGAEATQ